uniref:type II toxin-antitoxin system prevent-host-death family antitoxin n=1 Tax=Streptomyces sp. NRRL B-1347 TaxID=1476877 RepID=UPI0007C4F13B
MSTYSIVEARAKIGELARRAAAQHERITLTDRGVPVGASLIADSDLEDLEDALAIARYELQKERGTLRLLPHDQAMRILDGEEEM